MADYLLVPCVATWLGLRSITEMIRFVDTHLRDAHIESERLGVALTFYTTRRAGPELVRQEARKIFRNRLLRTIIRERTELDYSQEAHKSIFEYSPHSDSAEDYSSLTKEVIRRMAQIES
ncbi:MAG: ParA family protein [Acidobacteriota bacterium]